MLETLMRADVSRNRQAIPSTVEPEAVGRYLMYGEIASGGMAAVHFGLLNGPVGFRRAVAIKRLHRQFASDEEFVAQFLDEARLAARIRHPNVVQTLDVVAEPGQLLLVMEYIDGETLARLLALQSSQSTPMPIAATVSVLVGALHGLHAAHEARDERGEPLCIVHRDFSPQNILVGKDGVARVLDFGVAKAAARIHSTEGAKIKGKLRYMAPEQVEGQALDRRADVFSAGIILWQALTGKKLFDSDGGPGAIIQQVLHLPISPPSKHRPEISPGMDEVVLRALERDLDKRFQSAHDMAVALERVIQIMPSRAISDWVVEAAGAQLEARARVVADIESSAHDRSDPRTELPEFVAPLGRLSSPAGDDVTVTREEDSKTRAMPTKAPVEDVSQVTGASNWTAPHRSQRHARLRIGGFVAGALVLLSLITFGFYSPLNSFDQENAGAGHSVDGSGAVSSDTSLSQQKRAVTTERHLDLHADQDAPEGPDQTAEKSSPSSGEQQSQPASSDTVSSASPERATSVPKPRSSLNATPVAKSPSRGTKGPAVKPQDPCANPTYVDENGIQRFKRQCL